MNEQTLKHEITTVLENCVCLGRDAYGAYIEKMTNYLMTKIKETTLQPDKEEVLDKLGDDLFNEMAEEESNMTLLEEEIIQPEDI